MCLARLSLERYCRKSFAKNRVFGKNIKKGEEGHIGGVVFKRGVKPSAHYADKMEVIRLDVFPKDYPRIRVWSHAWLLKNTLLLDVSCNFSEKQIGNKMYLLTFPGSSFERGTLTKHLFNDKL